jgi:hypothetical protein
MKQYITLKDITKTPVIVSAAITFALFYYIRSIDHNVWLNTSPEKLLGLTCNIHHDFIGIAFMAAAIFYPKMKNSHRLYLLGIGIGLFMEHILSNEGLKLIEAL